MRTGKWQSKEQLVDLLSKLVSFRSITGSADEIAIAHEIAGELGSLPYFQQNQEHVKLHSTGDGRHFVTALVKKGESVRNTVVLISHFDVVDVQDFGKWKNLAFDLKELTKMYHKHQNELPGEVQKDLTEGEWVFGRGSMDMKCGLALHMSMIERACQGEFEGNLLLLTVPDEEVNSVGMRAAVPVLLELAKQHQLDYHACLNSEPIFPRYPGDVTKYVYSGSLGKVLPGFFCYGKETHVGEPFSGLNANSMVSQITCELELNTSFCEEMKGEVSAPPTSLQQKDLKKEYSVQIPDRAVALFNMFLMEKPLHELVTQLRQLAETVAGRIEQTYAKQASIFAERNNSIPISMKVKVLQYEELLEHARKTHGDTAVERLVAQVLANRGDQDDRQVTIQLIDELGLLCKELSPMIVLFFAPPYYPAVSSHNDPRIKSTLDEIIAYAKEQHGLTFKQNYYFPGLCDLSYATLQESTAKLQPLTSNMPLWERGYSLPLKELEELYLPVMNLGPFGKDAHKWTERLDVDNAFHTMVDMLPIAIKRLLQ